MVGKFKLFAMASVMAMAAAPAFAQQDTNALRNMRVPQAQAELSQKGYSKATTLQINGAAWDMWRSPNGQCLGFTSFNGLVTDARDADPVQCAPQVTSAPGVQPYIPPQQPQVQSSGPANPSYAGNPNAGFGGNNGNGGNRYNNGNNNNRFNVDQLRNMGVKTAQATLSQNGYGKVRSINYQGKQWDLYVNRNDCIGFASLYGTVSDTRSFETRDCGGDNNNNNGGFGGNNNRRFDASQLRQLRVNAAQDRLRNSGFQKTGSTNIDGKQWDLWYNDDYRDGCIGFTSYNGNVTDADTFSNSRCGDDNRGGFGNNNYGNNGNGFGRSNRTFDLNAFDKMPVKQAQSALGRNGYAKTKSIKLNNQQWDLYLNDDYRNSCVGFTSYNGNVTQTRNFEDRDCR